MSEQNTTPPGSEQEGTARVHRGSKLTKFQGKLRETDHIKKILAVAGAGIFLLVAVIVIHGPNKRHHEDQKPANVAQDAPGMDLHAYQQEVEAAQRRRESAEREQAVTGGGSKEAAPGTGIMQPAPTDDPSDISYIKQAWRQPQTWDDGQQNTNASSAASASATHAARPQAPQVTSDDIQSEEREQQLRARLDKIRARQAALLRQREEASP
ncbi:hypothetical protein [Gluconacetobacter diazotrophicus]|uniref:Uncharacterized protein n=1 Tax=Gluconacetobacter diazotrophicus (strain ATCC 49037 / DSM 5601 / CCUG 37298 / CIP 103539 / LMG 7603 / PAl5) TaxID=272568 RepID=A9HSZ0_GLUDA|nr:hypothetical protein [Gluconacetobacter diazotrophicus]CAP57844.1 hypothetical protein GDI3880 [Gluconacetobacter diazotrophicus PA1 5]